MQVTDKMDELKSLLVIGNAFDEGLKNSQRGWFIGHFISPDYGLRCTQGVEVKWGTHRTGEQKVAYGTNEEGTTLTILISGSFIVDFPELNNSVSLETTGDFVIFARGVIHGWKALEDSVVLTVRWPSLPHDQKQCSVLSTQVT